MRSGYESLRNLSLIAINGAGRLEHVHPPLQKSGEVEETT
jgi:hypothetical protein